MLDTKCPVAWRKGRHETYVNGGVVFCKACGESRALESVRQEQRRRFYDLAKKMPDVSGPLAVPMPDDFDWGAVEWDTPTTKTPPPDK